MHLQSESGVEGSWNVTARNFPTNRGGLCQKGWTSAELLNSPERLLTPLVRDARTEPLLRFSEKDELNAKKEIASRLSGTFATQTATAAAD
jgi:assimilatory nitrate reductase catalytic subunit